MSAMPLELLWALELVLVSVSLSAEKRHLVWEWGATMANCSAITTASKSGSKMAQELDIHSAEASGSTRAELSAVGSGLSWARVSEL